LDASVGGLSRGGKRARSRPEPGSAIATGDVVDAAGRRAGFTLGRHGVQRFRGATPRPKAGWCMAVAAELVRDLIDGYVPLLRR
jgi:hypothetical protein